MTITSLICLYHKHDKGQVPISGGICPPNFVQNKMLIISQLFMSKQYMIFVFYDITINVSENIHLLKKMNLFIE